MATLSSFLLDSRAMFINGVAEFVFFWSQLCAIAFAVFTGKMSLKLGLTV
jgi:hypothetical protein